MCAMSPHPDSPALPEATAAVVVLGENPHI